MTYSLKRKELTQTCVPFNVEIWTANRDSVRPLNSTKKQNNKVIMALQTIPRDAVSVAH